MKLVSWTGVIVIVGFGSCFGSVGSVSGDGRGERSVFAIEEIGMGGGGAACGSEDIICEYFVGLMTRREQS